MKIIDDSKQRCRTPVFISNGSDNFPLWITWQDEASLSSLRGTDYLSLIFKFSLKFMLLHPLLVLWSRMANLCAVKGLRGHGGSPILALKCDFGADTSLFRPTEFPRNSIISMFAPWQTPWLICIIISKPSWWLSWIKSIGFNQTKGIR